MNFCLFKSLNHWILDSLNPSIIDFFWILELLKFSFLLFRPQRYDFFLGYAKKMPKKSSPYLSIIESHCFHHCFHCRLSLFLLLNIIVFIVESKLFLLLNIIVSIVESILFFIVDRHSLVVAQCWCHGNSSFERMRDKNSCLSCLLYSLTRSLSTPLLYRHITDT